MICVLPQSLIYRLAAIRQFHLEHFLPVVTPVTSLYSCYPTFIVTSTGFWNHQQCFSNGTLKRLTPQELKVLRKSTIGLNGYVSKRNCRIWAGEQPKAIQEQPLQPLHPLRTTFFRDESGANVTVNGERYRAMINDFLMPESEARDLHNIWFQQGGVTCHAARETMNLLRGCFGVCKV
ncbi:uncharacterized protein LOC129250182 [Anastrepha obliqua]|uniref:uncharacterized protein LOC129250182 n=1 Tax=Anastrepha obliqua TaxID=95512 RepID=UPI002409AC40|nr:uncharacterized protein LOC129250182 [Anastrepha obliqua]